MKPRSVRRERGWSFEVVEGAGRVLVGDGIELDIDAIYDGVFDLPEA